MTGNWGTPYIQVRAGFLKGPDRYGCAMGKLNWGAANVSCRGIYPTKKTEEGGIWFRAVKKVEVVNAESCLCFKGPKFSRSFRVVRRGLKTFDVIHEDLRVDVR
jgi:hypothetical protein